MKIIWGASYNQHNGHYRQKTCFSALLRMWSMSTLHLYGFEVLKQNHAVFSSFLHAGLLYTYENISIM